MLFGFDFIFPLAIENILFERIVFERVKPPFFIFWWSLKIKKEVTQNCPLGRSISLQLFCLIFQIWYLYLSITLTVEMQSSIILINRPWGTFQVRISRKKLIYPSRWYILWQQKTIDQNSRYEKRCGTVNLFSSKLSRNLRPLVENKVRTKLIF